MGDLAGREVLGSDAGLAMVVKEKEVNKREARLLPFTIGDRSLASASR